MEDGVEVLYRVGEIAALVAGAGFFLYRVGNKVGEALTKFETVAAAQGDELKELKQEVSKLNEVITMQAVQTQRVDYLEQRVTLLDGRYEELRHGKGYVNASNRD